jgi:hypothetical protein
MKLSRREFELRLEAKLDGSRDVLVKAADLELLLTHCRRQQLRQHRLERRLAEYKFKIKTNRSRLHKKILDKVPYETGGVSD